MISSITTKLTPNNLHTVNTKHREDTNLKNPYHSGGG
jgi:hypothetical protein